LRGTPAADTAEVATVAGLTHDGDGIVRAGKTVFVPGALPGERIRFRRVRHHRQHDAGQLLEVLEPAAARVVPLCPHFGTCGGCALQHLAPQAQLEAKQIELRDNFERVARITPDTWLPPLRGPAWGYRRRARLGAKYVAKKGRVVVGFRERAAPYVAALERCEILTPPVGDLIAPLSAMLTRLSIRARTPQIEVAVADNAVALVLRVLDPPSGPDLDLLREFAAAQRVRLYLQPGGLESVRELQAARPNTELARAAAGAPVPQGGQALRYGLPRFGLQLEFAPTDFIQINATVNEALVARAVELLELTPAASVLDLYCGIGNFTLALAQAAGRVVGVEGEATLVERARHNARCNNVSNAEFHMADLGQPPEAGVPWLRQAYTHVLLDPPRVGAREVLATIARLEPRRVLYISCHPGSLARDLAVLVHEHGFTLKAAGVLDMFPHTAHVESLALLTGAT